MSLIEHPDGGYRFLPGIAPYSCGAVSVPGFEIVNVTLQRPLPYQFGFERIAAFLATTQRPKAALCAVALRCPVPYTFPGFSEFNRDYSAILEGWDVFVDGINPVARTNVSPVVAAPTEPVLYGFSYTKPCASGEPPTFVVAGGGELPEGKLSREDIVALGDISPNGLAIKARFVMDLMENRLHGLGVDWKSVTLMNVYTAHPLAGLLPEVVLGRVGESAIHGVHWHYSRPPIEEIEFEMDVRGTRTEIRRH